MTWKVVFFFLSYVVITSQYIWVKSLCCTPKMVLYVNCISIKLGKNKQNRSQIGQCLKRHVNTVVGSHRMRSQTEIRIRQEGRRVTEARKTAHRCPRQHRHSGTWKSRSTGMKPWPRSFLQPWWENWRGERLESRQVAGHTLSSVREVWRLKIGSITWKWICCANETRNNMVNWREHWSGYQKTWFQIHPLHLTG